MLEALEALIDVEVIGDPDLLVVDGDFLLGEESTADSTRALEDCIDEVVVLALKGSDELEVLGCINSEFWILTLDDLNEFFRFDAPVDALENDSRERPAGDLSFEIFGRVDSLERVVSMGNRVELNTDLVIGDWADRSVAVACVAEGDA